MSKREKIEAMLAEDPSDPFLLYSLGIEWRKESAVENALTAFDQTIAADPNHVAAYFQKGQVLAEAEREDECREVLEKGIEVARTIGEDHTADEMEGFLDLL